MPADASVGNHESCESASAPLLLRVQNLQGSRNSATRAIGEGTALPHTQLYIYIVEGTGLPH